MAFTLSKLLNTPFWSLYSTMLPFILYRDLHASAALVAFALAIKPLSSLIAPYWSAALKCQTGWLRKNIIWGNLLGHLPFFFTPFFDSPWFLTLSGAFYMILARGVTPVWMEILKLQVETKKRTALFAWSSALTYLGDALFACIAGLLLDDYKEAWRWLFPFTALLSCSAIFWQYKLPTLPGGADTVSPSRGLPTFAQLCFQLKKPWVESWRLLKRRPDFMRFQIGFTFGGGALMIIHGALPTFFVDVLNISYSEVGLALGLCKGIGFILATPTWASFFNRLNIYQFNGWVTAMALTYPLLLFFAPSNIIWLYGAYLCYGVMQGGSEIGWNLSGVAFSQKEESTPYTIVNVLMVGLRGILTPLSGFLCLFISPYSSILLGAIFSLLATQSLFAFSRKYERAYVNEPEPVPE